MRHFWKKRRWPSPTASSVKITREAAEFMAELIAEHEKADPYCLCRILKTIPEVQAVIAERRALETLRTLSSPTIH